MAGVSKEAKTPRRRGVWRLVGLGALSGLLAGYTALATAELVSAAVRPESSPVVAVGGAAIDRTPAGVKDWAIRHFGTDDKLVLQLGILGVLTLLALALGALAARYRRIGAAGVLMFGLVGGLPRRADRTPRASPTPCRRWRVQWWELCSFITSSGACSPADRRLPSTRRPSRRA